MSRPTSVTAAAVVAFLGSALTLLMGVGMIGIALGGSAPTPLPPRFGIGIGAMFIALSALGIGTGVGLLRLRSWARITTLIFSGAMALFSAFGAAIVIAMPIPQTATGGVAVARAVIAAVYLVPALVGVWWLVLFTRRRIVAAFAEGATGAASGRPLSVSVIAYWNVIGGVGTLMTSALGVPAFVLGAVIRGWAGSATYLFLGTLTLYAGLGLLRLRESARVLAITLFGLTVAQTAIMFASPSARARMFAAQQAMAPAETTPQPMPFDPQVMGLWFMAVGALLAVMFAWLLVRAKAAFHEEVTGDQ
jgi:hypothetical protein